MGSIERHRQLLVHRAVERDPYKHDVGELTEEAQGEEGVAMDICTPIALMEICIILWIMRGEAYNLDRRVENLETLKDQIRELIKEKAERELARARGEKP